MIKSTLIETNERPQLAGTADPHRATLSEQGAHVAIVMDGNGRWAEQRGHPRWEGHRAGARTVSRIVEAAPTLGISTLTLFAFSSDNWRRPVQEIDQIMHLFQSHLHTETELSAKIGARLSVIGRRSRLSKELLRQIEFTENRTRAGKKVHVRFAFDYSARDAILGASVLLLGKRPTREAFGRAMAKATHSPPGVGDVDLLIRTGGERRLSDFLLWECAYAEFIFTKTLWPDYSVQDISSAVQEFRLRSRRFGGLPEQAQLKTGGAKTGT